MKESDNNDWLFLIAFIAFLGTAYLCITHINAFIEVSNFINPR